MRRSGRQRKTPAAFGVAVLVWGLTNALPAHAYLCSRVPPQGPSLFWATRDVPVLTNEQGSSQVVDDSDFQAVSQSLATWNAVSCADILLRDAGLSSLRATGYNWHDPQDNQNLIVWRSGSGDALDDWDHEIGSIAVTTTTFNSRTGEILDADIEFNDISYHFTACTPPQAGCIVKYDIQNTLTHELGHVLGLDHPPSSQVGASDATMYYSAPEGETKKRDLAADDEDGLCFLYPTDSATGHCFGDSARTDPEPIFQQIGQNPDNGCLCAGAQEKIPPRGGLLLALSIFTLAVRRRLAL